MKKINLIILVLTLSIFSFNSLLAQTKGFSTFETESLFKDNSLTNLSTNTLNQTDGFTFGSIIYSDFYKLGPGDVLLYQNLLEEPNQQYIYVSPECKIFIPRIGELDILGKSLTDVKKLVLEAVKQKN
jgi:protein involved in polysaccharide export with SLBB domain